MVDRMLAFIIIFLGISILMAAVLAMGAVPKIFQNTEISQETKNETKNQTEIIIKQFMRENNTTHKMLVNQNVTIQNQGIVIDKLNQSLENQRLMLMGINKTIEHNQKDIGMNLNISKQHEIVARDHNILQEEQKNLQEEQGNITDHIDKKLKEYGENSVQKFIEIRAAQDNLNKTLQEIKQKVFSRR